MANLLTHNPIVIEGVLASYKAGVTAQLGTLSTLRIESIYWLQPNLVGDVALIVDPQNGNELFRARCEVAGQSQYFTFRKPRLWRDFSMVQLDSGRIYIYTV